MRSQQASNKGPENFFVNKSDILYLPGSNAICCIFAATDSLTLWYAMALCFFVSVEAGLVTFLTTLSLSQYQMIAKSFYHFCNNFESRKF